MFGYSLEAPWQGASNEYPQHMFLWRTGENYPIIITKYSSLTIPLTLANDTIWLHLVYLKVISLIYSLSTWCSVLQI